MICSNKLVIFISFSFQYLKLRYGLSHFVGVKSSKMLVLVAVIFSLFLYEFGSNFPEKIYIY